MKKPFMFGEAKLPKDFPPPGPVGEVIVKTYPAARAAVIRSTAGGGNADQDKMFMPLFNHIQSHQIAMSAPVEISWSTAKTQTAPAPTAMAFFYGDPGIGKPGVDGAVDVLDVAPMQVVSIGVRGSYNQGHFEAALKQLDGWLADHCGKYKVVGPPRYLGYNSPFVPWFMRYGEVQLPVVIEK